MARHDHSQVEYWPQLMPVRMGSRPPGHIPVTISLGLEGNVLPSRRHRVNRGMSHAVVLRAPARLRPKGQACARDGR